MANRTLERRKLTKASVGEMRERVSLERRSTVPPDFGEPENTIDYTVIAEVWAKVDSISYQGSGEKMYNGVNISRVPALRFTVRFRSDVTTFDTAIRWRGQLYQINAVDSPEERQQYTYLTSFLKGDDTLGANQ